MSPEDLEYSLCIIRTTFMLFWNLTDTVSVQCKNSPSVLHRTIPLKVDFILCCCMKCPLCTLHIDLLVCLCVSLSQRGQERAVSRAATPEARVCEEDSVSYRSGPWCSGEHALPGLLQRPCQAHQRPAVWRVSLNNFCLCAQDISDCNSEKNSAQTLDFKDLYFKQDTTDH